MKDHTLYHEGALGAFGREVERISNGTKMLDSRFHQYKDLLDQYKEVLSAQRDQLKRILKEADHLKSMNLDYRSRWACLLNFIRTLEEDNDETL